VPFLDRKVIASAGRMLFDVKLRDGVEEWLLRTAMDGILPRGLVWQSKARMAEGTGLYGSC
jgi:asparagine synthase (glutamine-hydrolysing)